MEVSNREEISKLNRHCRDLARMMKSLPNGLVECEQPFDMEAENLDRMRYELINSQHLVVQKTPSFRVPFEKEYSKSARELLIAKEIDDMRTMMGIQRQYVQNIEEDSELNEDTRKCFFEILETIEDAEDEELERSHAKRKLFEAKLQLSSVLEKFYPEYKSELLAIMEKLEKSSKNDEEDGSWVDLSDQDHVCVLILKKAMIIEQHKTKLTNFRFAPLL